MKLCLMILSVPWYMFNGLEHTAILSHFLTFITGSSSRVSTTIGKPQVSPLRFLNTSAVIRYLICVYASHFFAGRPYHFNQTLRTTNKF